MEVGFYLFFIIIMLLVLLNDDVMMIVNKIVCMYTNLGESITIPVSRVLLYREASLSIVFSTGMEYFLPRCVIYCYIKN
jgi:hypothetical protein